MRGKRLLAALFAVIWMVCLQAGALAYQEGTLYSGVRSEAVREMQEALIQLGYLGGTPDGVFGTHTELAVKKFQRANGLKADGVAGAKTLELIYQKAGKAQATATTAATTNSQASSSSTSESASASQAGSSTAASTAAATTTSAASSSSSGLFGGNYTTLRLGNTGTRVKALQQRLIDLGYLKGSADGKFGKQTRLAVIAFQKANHLTADGLAGRKTLQALEGGGAAASSTTAASTTAQTDTAQNTAASTQTQSGGDPSSTKTVSGPSGSEVKLLHWFNDIKPTLKSGQTLYIYEPSSGMGWNLRIYSCGRHCDAEPCTAEDTANMLQAFGGQNTWSQKAVYVQLPNGTWTIGATHDMPHLSGTIKDNNFNGHLCVHFLRTMSEASKNDPHYGVSNQNTIRSFWNKLTGEIIAD